MALTKVKRVTDSLPCELTDDERLQFADDLAEANQSVDTAKANKASAMKQYNYEISLAETRRERLANIVASKTEYRDVVVEERWDWDRDEYTRTRTDTGEVIYKRHLTDDERQLPMLEDDGESFSEDSPKN